MLPGEDQRRDNHPADYCHCQVGENGHQRHRDHDHRIGFRHAFQAFNGTPFKGVNTHHEHNSGQCRHWQQRDIVRQANNKQDQQERTDQVGDAPAPAGGEVDN